MLEHTLPEYLKYPWLTYGVFPSFDESQRLEIEMKWNVAASTYKAHVVYRFGHRERAIPTEVAAQLLQRVRNLRLPTITSGHAGLDGTYYEMSVGSVPTVSFQWWEELPAE